MPETAPSFTTAQPKPARHRVRKVAGVIVILLLVAVPVAHLCWSAYERSQLAALVAQYRSAGEPALPEDFSPSIPGDPNNPVIEFEAAVNAVLPRTNDPRWHDLDPTGMQFPLTPKELAKLDELVRLNQRAYAHVDAAVQMRGMPDWRIQFASPAISQMLPSLSDQRKLANMLRAAAIEAHQRGDDSTAVERTRQMLSWARALHARPTLVAHLLANGITALGESTAREILPDLRIAPTDGERGATREQMRMLIADLLDERAQRDGQRLALLTERMIAIDSARAIAHGKIGLSSLNFTKPGSSSSSTGSAFLGYAFSPILYGDARLIGAHLTRLMAIGHAPDWQSCQQQLSILKGESDYSPQHLLYLVFTPGLDRALQWDYRVPTETRLTAIAVALRCYAADHERRLPATLGELVPTYLPAIPLDPMSSGSSLKYRPDPSDPIVYSTGDDGVDDGGSTQPTARGRDTTVNPWAAKDYVVHLNRQPRVLPPDDADPIDAPLPLTQPSANN